MMLAGDSDATIARAHDLYSSSVAVHRAKHLSVSPIRMSESDKAQYHQALKQFDIASKAFRLSKLQSAFARLESLMDARGIDAQQRAAKVAEMIAQGEIVEQGLVPHVGSETGLLDDNGRFDVYAFREYRSTLEQVAKELGEWDITGAGDRADAGGGANITIVQSVRGDIHQGIAAADPRPGALPIPAPPAPKSLIRGIQASLSQHSMQSDGGDDTGGQSAADAVIEVDPG